MKRIVKIFIILIAVIAVYRIGTFIAAKIAGRKTIVAEKHIPVKAVAAKKMNLTETISLTGDVVGTEVVNVFSQVPGKVQHILIKEGQRVYKGQTIMRIDRDIIGMDYMPAVVEAPISGYVGAIYAQKGMSVAQTVPLAQLVNMNSVEVKVKLTEDNMNRVQPGMKAEINVEAYAGRTFMGTVVKKSAIIDPVSRTQETYIMISNRDLTLRHGMFANVKIIAGYLNNVTVVPSDAVFSDEQGLKYVMIAENSFAVKKSIQTGKSIDYMTEIRSGVNEGDIVVTLGKENTTDGDKLLIYREDAAPAVEENKTKDPEAVK
jgi:multidrug efflux pump subunit AcrA (membrane-fusion protein)